MEIIVEGIPIIMTVSPATDDDDPRLIATIKDSDIVYSCSLHSRLSKHLYVTNNVYESLRNIIASKDTHLFTVKFTDNYYNKLRVETFFYYGNSKLEFKSDCPNNRSSLQQIYRTIEKYKKDAANTSNHKLLECIEKLTERVATLEAHILR
jgi:hypothetical protein